MEDEVKLSDINNIKTKLKSLSSINLETEKISKSFLISDIIGRVYAKENLDDGILAFSEIDKVGDYWLDINFLKNKVAMTKDDFMKLGRKYKKYAFTVANYTKESKIKEIQKILYHVKKKGGNYQDFLKATKGKYKLHPLVYWQNVKNAQAAGRYQQMISQVDYAPYWQYIAVLDKKTRPEHEALHNTIMNATASFWDRYYPPNGYNCRCMVRSLSERYMRKKGLRLTTKPKRVKIDKGFDYNVGKVINKWAE